MGLFWIRRTNDGRLPRLPRYRSFDPDGIGRSLRGIKPQCQEGTKISPQSYNSGFVELRSVMNNPDQDTLVRAVEDARRILGEYIDSGPRDATRTVERLLAVLDRNDVVHALDRINRRRVIRLVWSDDQPA